jgi:hypothetical protein
MRILHHGLYATLAAIALLLVYCAQVQAQERVSLMQYVMQERPALASLVAKAGLTPLLSDDNASFTILAPPETELRKLEELPAARVRAILSGHIIKGVYLEKNLRDGATIETLARTKVNICRKKDYVMMDGVRIASADKMVGKSILHNLSGVLNL